MANIEHRTLGNLPTKTHGIVKDTVANAAALAAYAISADDVAQKIIIRQLDTDQLWVPVSTTPTFQLVTQYPTGLRESGGPTNLDIGAIPTQSLLARVGSNIVAAAFGAALSFSAGTLSIGQVSNTTQGVLTAITAANAIPQSNGAGTAVTWTALSPAGGSPVGTGRTISTTAPLAGGGDLSANRTLSVATVSNTSSGVVPQTNGTAGQALLATAGATTWSTNFQAQDLQTTGNILLGTTLPSTGTIRMQNASTIYSISTALSDSKLVHYTNGNGAIFGDNPSPTILNGSTTSLRVSNADYVVCQSGSIIGLSVVNLRFDSTLTNPVFFQQGTATNSATGQILSIHAQHCTGTTTTGGVLLLQGGTGTTAGGAVKIQSAGGTNRLQANDTGVGLYTATPVAQASRVGQFTDATTGTPGNTIADGGATYSQSTTNNNNASFLAKFNALELLIHNIGASA